VLKKTTLTTAVAAVAVCLTFMPVQAADRPSTSGTVPNHHRSSHRSSAASKSSAKRNAHSSGDRLRRSAGSRRNHDRQRGAANRDASEQTNESIQPDANVQVELPRHESDAASDNENQAEDDDKSNVLLGNETEGGGPP
jgi:hypothetical protein